LASYADFSAGFKNLLPRHTFLQRFPIKLPSSLHNEFRAAFRILVGKLSEQYDPSKSVVAHEDFLHFGLADTAISMIAPGQHLVLTDEFALIGLLHKRKVDVINFNHLRTFAWEASGQ
jgi:hypothetical protein